MSDPFDAEAASTHLPGAAEVASAPTHLPGPAAVRPRAPSERAVRSRAPMRRTTRSRRGSDRTVRSREGSDRELRSREGDVLERRPVVLPPVPLLGELPPPPPRSGLRTLLASPRALRDAFLLREVLGPPVALRRAPDDLSS